MNPNPTLQQISSILPPNNALIHITFPTTITLVQATSITHPDPWKSFLRVLSASTFALQT